MEDNIGCKDDLKACRMWLLSSQGEIKGKLRGIFQCGPNVCGWWWWLVVGGGGWFKPILLLSVDQAEQLG